MPKGFPKESKPRTPAQILQQQFFLDLGNIKMVQARVDAYKKFDINGCYFVENYLEDIEYAIRHNYEKAKAALKERG